MDLPVVSPNIPTHDNTMFNWWNSCPRLYKFCAIDGLRKKTKAPALSWGGLMHDGFAEWYISRNVAKALLTINNHPDWQDEEEEIDDEGMVIEKEEDFRTKARALVKFSDYVQYWGLDPNWEILLTETPFEINDETGFKYGGKIDLIVRWNGKPWIVDHKTTTRFGNTLAMRNRFYQQFENSPQMAGYTWGGSQLHGEPIAGVIVNVITIHKIPKPAEQQLDRRALLFSSEKIAEWKAMRIEEYREIEEAKTRNVFRPRWDSCVGKYGPCAFYEVCRLPKASRQRVLEADFEVNPWDWRKDEL